MAYNGKFKPKNPSKYKGNPTNIVYRSLWELKLMMMLDAHKNIIQWSSEEIIIPYKSPADRRMHRYFPDFYVKQINKDGVEEEIMIEVKPFVQTYAPSQSKKLTPKGNVSRRYKNDVIKYAINEAKWVAASKYCEKKGWKFQIMTENELYGKNVQKVI